MEATIKQKNVLKNGPNAHNIEKRERIQIILSNIIYMTILVSFLAIIITIYGTTPFTKTTIHLRNKYSANLQIISGNLNIDAISLDAVLPKEARSYIQHTDSIIHMRDVTLVKKDLPDLYYQGLDFSSFQPFMGYKKITDVTSPAYEICYSDNAYTDEHGFRRYKTDENQFKINGEDDYMVALGTYYKEPGTVGSRFLVVTSTGMFTIVTGSEKADVDTDQMNMYSIHGNGELGGLIEWIVDEESLDKSIKAYGTVTKGPVSAMQGSIIALYEIK